MKRLAYCLFETPMGWFGIAWSECEESPTAVVYLQLPEASAKITEARLARRTGVPRTSVAPASIAALIDRIRRHFAGDVQDFRDIVVDFEGAGPFARDVYEAARAIPPGRTLSYGGLAGAMNRPKAARAVGQALGKNPIALIVPCHRILGAGGKPGGFSAHGGRDTKSRLLALEGVSFERPRNLKTAADVRRAAAQLVARDPRLVAVVARPITFRLKRNQSPYASLFEAVVHQQLAIKAASAILGRVKAIYPANTIPEPEMLLETSDEDLRAAGLSRAKLASVKDLAAKTLDGTVPSSDAIRALSDDEILERLTSIRGIGRWTVEMLLIFHLGRSDVFPVDDYALRRVIGSVYGMADVPTPKQVLPLGELWRPHRTAASLYFWNMLNSNGATTK